MPTAVPSPRPTAAPSRRPGTRTGTIPTARRLVTRAQVSLVRGTRRVVDRWRSSMQVRVVTTALAVGVASIAMLGFYLSSTISNGLYEDRVDQVERESLALTQMVRTTFAASSAPEQSELIVLVNGMLRQLQTSGSSAQDFFLLHEPDITTPVIDPVSREEYRDLITPELREANRASDVPVLQPVAIAGSVPGQVAPGVMVGSTAEVPTLGTYEVYYLYSLEEEQQTLSFLQQVLLAGAVVMLVLIGVITWLVTRQAVRPVTRAAIVAERLADGHLSERMPGARGRDEMATLARSFNEMATSLQDQIRRMEELSALQRRFVSDVSHELRTPLTTIRMASEVIHESRDELDPAAKRSAELLQEQIDRFESLLADLLEISRFDAGAAALDAETRDVRDLVTLVVEQAMPLAERKEVVVSVELPDVPATADIDPRRVERVLRNLVVNAIEHAEERPVEITVAEDPWSVAVVVRDYGVGMTKQEVEHVFDRFWRADPARARTTGGTGLGLAIALEDARLHAGSLDAWGRPGQGASFRLTLPRRAGIALREPPIAVVPPSHGPHVTTGQMPVLHPPTGPSPTTIPDLADAFDPDDAEVR